MCVCVYSCVCVCVCQFENNEFLYQPSVLPNMEADIIAIDGNALNNTINFICLGGLLSIHHKHSTK